MAADDVDVDLGILGGGMNYIRVELDTAALVMPESFLARVDRVAVAEVELVASPWSAPGLDAVVRGVTVGRPAQSERRRRVIETRKGEKRGGE
uniref:Uncharacterized protein n=1 Tax=Oryza meridionalis TaxID=40149 RepID=A0A0E0F5W4_9ORYZ